MTTTTEPCRVLACGHPLGCATVHVLHLDDLVRLRHVGVAKPRIIKPLCPDKPILAGVSAVLPSTNDQRSQVAMTIETLYP